MNEQIVIMATNTGIMCSFLFSMFSFIISCYFMIDKLATKRSTHVIEYRDPFKEYPDELSLVKEESGKVKIKESKEDPEMQDEYTIDEMNKFIKANEVML